MGRKKGFDERKIAKIVSVLAANPDGVWLRRIAKDTGYSPATIAHYLHTILAPLTEDISLGPGENGKPLLRVVRLKPFVLEKLHEGRDIRQIMKILRLMSKIG